MDILLANPRGFCAGVDRAIDIVEQTLKMFGSPIYVRHEVVHNRFVVEGLRKRGAIFVDELDDVPEGSTLIFSAHGVSQAVRKLAQERNLRIFDATCPLVTKVHLEVARHSLDGNDVVLIGHRGHPEVEGTMGQYISSSDSNIYLVETSDDVEKLEIKDGNRVAFVTQTTLSIDDSALVIKALHRRFPQITGPRRSDICYATTNRQDAVRRLAEACELVLVVGSPNSSNSNRLKEIAANLGTPSYLIDGCDDIQKEWLENVQHIGVTAGASAPDILVEHVIEHLKSWGAEQVVENPGEKETVVFSLPPELIR